VHPDEHDGPKAEQYQSTNFTYPQVATPLLTISVSGNVVTLGGGIQVGDVVGVILGALGASVAVQSGDNLGSIATRFGAACTAAGIANTVSGSAVTITSPGVPTFNVDGTVTVLIEAWRKRRVFWADLYCPDPFVRSFYNNPIEALYPKGTVLNLVDQTQAAVLSYSGVSLDPEQKDGAYIKRFRWLIDYVAVVQATGTGIVAVTQNAGLLVDGQPGVPFTFPLATQT
jgi:hypothetical protein